MRPFLPSMTGGGVNSAPATYAQPYRTPTATGGPRDSTAISGQGPVNANQNANARGGNINIMPGIGTAMVFLGIALVLAFIAWRVLS